jgi:hypothetical protein
MATKKSAPAKMKSAVKRPRSANKTGKTKAVVHGRVMGTC